MDQGLAFVIWSLTAAAAFVLGWVLRDLHSGLQRRLAKAGAGLKEDLGIALIPSTLIPAAKVGPADGLRPILQPISANVQGPPDGSSPNQDSDSRSASFADMPPLEELRALAHRIRLAEWVWNDAETSANLAEFMRSADRRSRNLLTHYRGSIEELQRASGSGVSSAGEVMHNHPCHTFER